MAKIRDLFVFECYTGLAFTDLKTLEDKNFVTDENGKKWIVKKRHKTNIVSTIPLMPVALEILEKYNYRLPMISNVKYNAYLKEIGDICELSCWLQIYYFKSTSTIFFILCKDTSLFPNSETF